MLISHKLPPCQTSGLTKSKFLKLCRFINYCLLGKQDELQNSRFSIKRHRIPTYSKVGLILLYLIFVQFLNASFSVSDAQGLNDLPAAPPEMQSTNYSDEACNFGPEAWNTVKKHHDTKLKNLERKTRQLCLLHPNSVDSKIALAKEYRGLGKELLNVAQYDKAGLAFKNAKVLLKDIASEQDLYKDTIKEIKGCDEKKKQRATFLAKVRLRRIRPSEP